MKMKKFNSFLLHGKHTMGRRILKTIDVNGPKYVVNADVFDFYALGKRSYFLDC